MKTLWSPVSKVICTRHLKQKAISSTPQGDYTHNAMLQMLDGGVGQTNLTACGRGDTDEERIANYRQDRGYKWTLIIEGTPGQWYLQDLLPMNCLGNSLAIDMGQQWYCANIRDLIHEALSMI